MSKKPLLIMPIEIKAREFPARAFLTGMAVQRGYEVILGRSKTVHRQPFNFPRGIYLENDATPKSLNFFTKARQLGSKIIAWDEESIVTLTDEIYAAFRVCPKTIALTEGFFTRGHEDKGEVVKRHPETESKLIPAGNPRLDILRPKWALPIEKKGKPGQKTILINSRFSIVNPFYIPVEKAKGNVFKKFGVTKDSKIGQHIHGWLEHAEEMFHDFAALTQRIAQEFPDARIIIRPHPAENHGFWKDLADKYENCESFYEGAAADWFPQADVLVHNSCTTAIEATLQGLPCFSYLPKGDNVYDAELPNSVSNRFYDMDSLIEAIRAQPLMSEEIREEVSAEARKGLSAHIACVDGGMTSSEMILDHIDQITLEGFSPLMAFHSLKQRARYSLSVLKHDIIGNLGKKDEKLAEARAGYATQKYPGVTAEEMVGTMKKYGFGDFEVTEYKKGWLKIAPAKGSAA